MLMCRCRFVYYIAFKAGVALYKTEMVALLEGLRTGTEPVPKAKSSCSVM